MRKTKVSLVIVILAIVLFGCGCKHEWEEATCDKPKTCKLCGETEGEPIKFSPVSFSFLDDADWSTIISNSLCAAYHEEPKHLYTFTFYDLDGNEINKQTVDIRNADGSWNGWYIVFSDNVYSLAIGYETKTDIKVYDYDFNLIIESTIDNNDIFNNGDPVGVDFSSYDGFQRIVNMKTNESFLGIDLTNKCECPVEDYYEAASKHGVNIDYDTSIWSYHAYDEMINGYLVETADKSSWGYVDLEDNEIKMFKDATHFTPSGYALVSNDGKTYDLIDTDMNVIAENVVEGKGASSYLRSNVFRVTSEDGSVTFYAIN